MNLDLESYRLNDECQNRSQIKTPPKQNERPPNRKLHFIKGPISLDWMSIAANLPGKTVHVALAIQFAHGVLKETQFSLSPKWRKQFGVGPEALRESLHRLRKAGLIDLEYRPGCAPIITLLKAPDNSP